MTGRAKIIHVEISEGKAGLFYATSPEIRELYVGAKTRDGAIEAVPRVIEELFAARGEHVRVLNVDDAEAQIPMPWVIVSQGNPVHENC